jgi:hypothetical protein
LREKEKRKWAAASCCAAGLARWDEKREGEGRKGIGFLFSKPFQTLNFFKSFQD